MKKIVCAICFILSFSASATEETTRKGDTLEFIRVTSFNEQGLDLLFPKLAEHFIEASGKELKTEEVALAAKKLFSSDAFLERFVPAFDQAFTHAEIKTLLQYYKSEEMKKFFKNYMELYSGLFPAYNEAVQQVVNNAPETEASLLKKLSDAVISVTKNNYKELVQDSEIPVIVDVYSTCCPPCKVVAPIFSELGTEFRGKVKFVKLNVDEELALSQELQVRAMPTFLFIKGGKIVDRHVGAINKEALLSKIEKNLLINAVPE